MQKSAAALVLTGAALAVSTAYAAGFQLTEQSSLGLGRAYAGAGIVGDDLSAVHYNPAGMTLLEGTRVQAGFTWIALNADIDGVNGQSENGRLKGQAIPTGYVTHQVNDNLWLGFAMSVPYGMGTEYDKNWWGANRGTNAKIYTFDMNPKIAWKVNDLISVGAGVSVQYAKADLGMGVMPGVQGEIDADSWDWGFNLGLMWSPLENLRFGLSYRSKINHHADGDLTVDNARINGQPAGAVMDTALAQLGVLGTYDASASLSTPAWAMATAAWDVNELLSLYATFRWTDWSSFKELHIDGGSISIGPLSLGRGDTITNEWQDTYLVSVGADLRFTNWWTFRAGIGYETSPIDNPSYRTAIIPDADRWWFAIGSSFQATDNMQIDVAAAMLHGVGEGSVYAEQGSNEKVGHFENLDAYLFGVQLVYKF